MNHSGRKVPDSGDSQRQPAGQDPGPEGHHQVPDEEGPLPLRGCRQCGNDGGGARPEHPLGHELPRVSPEEALAERQVPAHQVHHGTCPEALLNEFQSFVLLCISIKIRKLYHSFNSLFLFPGVYLFYGKLFCFSNLKFFPVYMKYKECTKANSSLPICSRTNEITRAANRPANVGNSS